VQIPRGDLVSALQNAGGITERRHDVQQDHLRVNAARKPRGLVANVPRCIREHNREKNLPNVQFHWCHSTRMLSSPAPRAGQSSSRGCCNEYTGECNSHSAGDGQGAPRGTAASGDPARSSRLRRPQRKGKVAVSPIEILTPWRARVSLRC